MATPLPDKLGLYYASKEIDADRGVLPAHTIGDDSTATNIVVTDIEQESGYWDGAIGFFTNASADNSKVCFHVRSWNKETNTLTLAQPLPSVPASGDIFRLILGGRYGSNTKLLGLKANEIQPELAPVTSTVITGVTVKYISPYLGTGTLTLYYYYRSSDPPRRLAIRMGTLAYGEETIVTTSGDYIVYAGDGSGFIIVTVDFALLPGTNTSARTVTFSLTQPKGNFIPSYEGYETNTGNVSDRYQLLVARNESTRLGDVMSAFSIWLNKPLGSNTTLTGALAWNATTVFINAATNWPSRGFWITNGTQYRYVLYRNDLTLYLAKITTGRLNFNNGLSEIYVGDTLICGNYEILVDEVAVTNGSWGSQNAAGYLMVQHLSVNPGSLTLYNGVNQVATTTGWTPYSRRNPIDTWINGSTVSPAPDIDIGFEIPDENGLFSNPPDEHTAPEGVSFTASCIDQNTALRHGVLSAGKSTGIWTREHILESMQARTDINGDINFTWY